MRNPPLLLQRESCFTVLSADSCHRRSGFGCSAAIKGGRDNASGETCTLAAWDETDQLRMLQRRRIARNTDGGAGTGLAADEQSFLPGKAGQFMLKEA